MYTEGIKVSVPSRGLYILIIFYRFDNRTRKGFRPLTGSLYSNHITVHIYDVESFRPLTGSLYSNLKKSNLKKEYEIVSVPSRGLYILIFSSEWIYLNQNDCFRPLTGSLYSNHSHSKMIEIILVSVPSRGLYILINNMKLLDLLPLSFRPLTGSLYSNLFRKKWI